MTGRPLRIALIGPHRHPIREPFAGGLEAHVWHLARRLHQSGHQVRLFAPEGSDFADPDYFFPKVNWRPTDRAAQDVSMPGPEYMGAHHDYLRLMLALSRHVGDDIDIVHNHALHPLPVAMAPALPMPMLTTLHTPPTPWLESGIELGEVDGHPRSRFAAVSNFTAGTWTRLPERPRVVHNGVDMADWPFGPGGDWLVWSGRLVPEKGAHLAIEAAERAGMRLRIAGPISDSAYFAERIAPRLNADIRYVGHLPHAELASLVGRSAATLVTPRWDEPFGLVVAESLACGTPVAAFARGGVPEVVGHESNGALVAADDVDALAAELPRVIGLDRAGIRHHAEADLSVQCMTQAYVELYREILAGRPGGIDDVVRAIGFGA